MKTGIISYDWMICARNLSLPCIITFEHLQSVGATKSASTAKSVVTTQVAVNLPALVEREGWGGGRR